MKVFKDQYKGKKVLITGHTGFKGSWLSTWLLKLGAKVVGYSLDVPTDPSFFEGANLASKVKSYFKDVRDLKELRVVINKEKPDYIFHLAAQSLVSVSYENPEETISTNVIGTMNVLECLRQVKKKTIGIIITSDKCYQNMEWKWGYRENDNLGGDDIYSGSKGAAELIINSYVKSFFGKNKNSFVRIGICRAGNVIGGGDWSKDRIVPDSIKSWSKSKSVLIRSPNATRPWQHVLEPLSGYLSLGIELYKSSKLHGEAYNFGPNAEQTKTVVELLSDLFTHWNNTKIQKPYLISKIKKFKEAGLLKLSCDKALFDLNWQSNLDYSETAMLVGQWYDFYYQKNMNVYEFSIKQIKLFEEIAKKRKRSWII
ncbi:CDP-glucose 4,6-dehydratase [Methylophilaceae bacterium]|nr:CDP-glucose 4,6-dehydratase [Methylophilaceae bacterium]